MHSFSYSAADSMAICLADSEMLTGILKLKKTGSFSSKTARVGPEKSCTFYELGSEPCVCWVYLGDQVSFAEMAQNQGPWRIA
jgi:hypothetical protein